MVLQCRMLNLVQTFCITWLTLRSTTTTKFNHHVCLILSREGPCIVLPELRFGDRGKIYFWWFRTNHVELWNESICFINVWWCCVWGNVWYVGVSLISHIDDFHWLGVVAWCYVGEPWELVIANNCQFSWFCPSFLYAFIWIMKKNTERCWKHQINFLFWHFKKVLHWLNIWSFMAPRKVCRWHGILDER